MLCASGSVFVAEVFRPPSFFVFILLTAAHFERRSTGLIINMSSHSLDTVLKLKYESANSLAAIWCCGRSAAARSTLPTRAECFVVCGRHARYSPDCEPGIGALTNSRRQRIWFRYFEHRPEVLFSKALNLPWNQHLQEFLFPLYPDDSQGL